MKQPEERALVPKLTLPPDIIDMPRLVDLIAGKAKGRTAASETSFFLNVGAIGASGCCGPNQVDGATPEIA